VRSVNWAVDVLVSNAGYGFFGAAEEVTDAQIYHQIATNLIGSIQFIRAAIPHLRQPYPKAARSRTRPSACITHANGASKVVVDDFVRRGCQSSLIFPKPIAPSIFRRDDSTFEKCARILFQQAAVVQRLFRISEVANVQGRPARKSFRSRTRGFVRSPPLLRASSISGV
jgi:hypothetical protein